MLKFHVAHVNIHECSTRKKVLGFRGDNGDPMVGLFTNVPGSRYATDAIADDHDVFHKIPIWRDASSYFVNQLTKQSLAAKYF